MTFWAKAWQLTSELVNIIASSSRKSVTLTLHTLKMEFRFQLTIHTIYGERPLLRTYWKYYLEGSKEDSVFFKDVFNFCYQDILQKPIESRNNCQKCRQDSGCLRSHSSRDVRHHNHHFGIHISRADSCHNFTKQTWLRGFTTNGCSNQMTRSVVAWQILPVKVVKIVISQEIVKL